MKTKKELAKELGISLTWLDSFLHNPTEPIKAYKIRKVGNMGVAAVHFDDESVAIIKAYFEKKQSEFCVEFVYQPKKAKGE